MVGGNPRAAQLVGLPANRLMVLACAIGGACAGLAGAIEVAAVHDLGQRVGDRGHRLRGHPGRVHRAQNRWRSSPVAILFGGFGAAGSLLQRRLGLPDASVLVLQGFAFVLILASESLRASTGRRSAEVRQRAPPEPEAMPPDRWQ